MITADNPFVLIDGSKIQYISSEIRVEGRLNDEEGTVVVDIYVKGNLTSILYQEIGRTRAAFTLSDLDALTTSGSLSERFNNGCEQLAVSYLSALTGNGGVTFEIV